MTGPAADGVWPLEAIWEALVPQLPGFTVEVLAHIDSTNSELMRRAREGRTEPTLLVARHQSAGRGRRGQTWLSADGGSLTFSLGLPLAPADWSGLSLAAGIGLARGLHPAIRLKWPNDLWFEDRKLAGILVETASLPDTAPGGALVPRYVVIGVGINIAARDAQGLSTPPAWLQELLPGIDAAQALERVAQPLVQATLEFAREGLHPLVEAFDQRDALKGRSLQLSDGRSGMACGISSQGALLVHTAAGMEQVISSEVSVRPVARGG